MNHKNGFNPLSRTTAHRRAMSRNMVTSLFRFERITTTKAKALEVRKAAEKLITRSKIDSVHNRRQVARFIQDEIIICSYQFAKSKANDMNNIAWDLVVIDEAHRLRNVYKKQNITANVIKQSLEHVHNKVLLTATPLQNSFI